MTNNATATARPASPKQVNYIRSLIERKGAQLLLAGGDRIAEMTSREASAMIDMLLAKPDAPKAAPAPRAEVPEGLHVTGGTVYKVQTSRTTGKRYAKRLDLVTVIPLRTVGQWEYAGAAPLRSLSESTVVTLEEAQAFGFDFGICMCCGALLTNPESIERGIGPVCATKF